MRQGGLLRGGEWNWVLKSKYLDQEELKRGQPRRKQMCKGTRHYT